MTPAAAAIDVFGGVRPLARAIGVDPSSVSAWQDTGLIPSKHHVTILDAAARLGLEFTAHEIVYGRDII